MKNCEFCRDSGWVIAYKESQPLVEFGFICKECDEGKHRGINQGRGAHYWDPEFIVGGWVIRNGEASL